MKADFLDTLEQDAFKKMGKYLVQALFNMLLKLIRPLATLTEVLFRSDLGERYMTSINAGVGFLLLILGIGLSFFHFKIPLGCMTLPIISLNAVGILFFGCSLALYFLYCCFRNRQAIIQRYQQGIRWHSLCSGTPMKNETLIVVGLIVLLIALGLNGLAILLLLSRLTSAFLRSAEAAEFYDRVLDAIDQQIEMENLSRAVTERLQPQQAEGFQAPLPAYVSGKFRERFINATQSKPPSPLTPKTTPSSTNLDDALEKLKNYLSKKK